MKTFGLVILLSLIVGPFSLASFSEDEIFDYQSPEEVEAARLQIQREFSDAILPSSLSPKEKMIILNQYQHLDPNNEVPQDLLEPAVLYFDLNKNKFPNQNYLAVINYASRSDQFRFFVVNLISGNVDKYHTAHGRGSDPDDDGYATSFGNVNNSGKSSLGFARTGEVYSGKFQRAIRLDGLSLTNSNIRLRAIVVHGSDKVHERTEIQGRSLGCPGLDWHVKDKVIDKIQGGTLINMGYSIKKM